jgi:hypothetical protein
MEKNLRIIENREWIVFSSRKKENKSRRITTTVRKWTRQRRVTSRLTSALDGISVNVDNLLFTDHAMLQGEISLLEAFLPELLELLPSLPEEEV